MKVKIWFSLSDVIEYPLVENYDYIDSEFESVYISKDRARLLSQLDKVFNTVEVPEQWDLYWEVLDADDNRILEFHPMFHPAINNKETSAFKYKFVPRFNRALGAKKIFIDLPNRSAPFEFHMAIPVTYKPLNATLRASYIRHLAKRHTKAVMSILPYYYDNVPETMFWPPLDGEYLDNTTVAVLYTIPFNNY